MPSLSLSQKLLIGAALGYGGYKVLSSGEKKTTFKGKTALITGAAGGLGREIALGICKRGASAIVLWDIQFDLLKETENLIKSVSPNCKVLCQRVNLAERADIYEAADSTKDFLNGESPYFIVNNAGIVSGNQGCLMTDDNKIELETKINTLAHVWMAKAFIPKMIDTKKGGHFINIASMAAYVSAGDLPTYSMSKKGAKGFAEGLNAEMRLKGYSKLVKVTLVCPGHIKTKLFKGFKDPLSMDPAYVAEKTIQAAEYEIGVIVLPRAYAPTVISIGFCEFLGYLNIPFIEDKFNPMKAWKDDQAEKVFAQVSKY